MAQIMTVTGHYKVTNLPRQLQYYQRVSSKEKQVMGDIITSSVRGEQPSQLSSIMPRTVLPGCNSCRRHKTVQVQHYLFK